MTNYAQLRHVAQREGVALTFRPVEQWPGILLKRHHRRQAPFTAPWSTTCVLLAVELRMLNAREVVVQLAVAERDVRQDGLPRADARFDHPGVIVSFTTPRAGGTLRFATDLFTTPADNVRAVALGLEALRKVDRYGIASGSEQYTGWLAIDPPAPKLTADGAARMLLDAAGWTSRDPERLLDRSESHLRRAVWRVVVLRYHPDRSGDPDRWATLDEAHRLVDEAVR